MQRHQRATHPANRTKKVQRNELDQYMCEIGDVIRKIDYDIKTAHEKPDQTEEEVKELHSKLDKCRQSVFATVLKEVENWDDFTVERPYLVPEPRIELDSD